MDAGDRRFQTHAPVNSGLSGGLSEVLVVGSEINLCRVLDELTKPGMHIGFGSCRLDRREHGVAVLLERSNRWFCSRTLWDRRLYNGSSGEKLGFLPLQKDKQKE